MTYHPIDDSHIKALKFMVPPDRFSTGESNLDLHSKDQSYHSPIRPEAVIWPSSSAEVSEILKYANANQIPVTGWGSGSSLEGNPIPVKRGIVLDFSQMNKILDIKDEGFQIDVEPGVIYKDLNKKLRHSGLFFPPDPGADATIGGMIANNASGTRTVLYGSTKDYVLRLRIVLANGEMIEIGNRATKSSSGYDLIHLIVGSEGTLGIVVEATLRLVGLPVEFSAAIVTFPSLEATGKAVFEIMRSGLSPASLEVLDAGCIKLINREKGLDLAVSPTLFMEFHGPSKGQLAEVLKMAEEICTDQNCSNFIPGLGREERDRFFSARYEMGEMIRRNYKDRTTISLDVAVPIMAYPEMVVFSKKTTEEIGIPAHIFSHAGNGNLHVILSGKKEDEKEWGLIEEINEKVVSKALSLGGTATGEHGVGIGKSRFMPAEHGKSLEWMKRIKSLFDPNGILNPGKIFP